MLKKTTTTIYRIDSQGKIEKVVDSAPSSSSTKTAPSAPAPIKYHQSHSHQQFKELRAKEAHDSKEQKIELKGWIEKVSKTDSGKTSFTLRNHPKMNFVFSDSISPSSLSIERESCVHIQGKIFPEQKNHHHLPQQQEEVIVESFRVISPSMYQQFTGSDSSIDGSSKSALHRILALRSEPLCDHMRFRSKFVQAIRDSLEQVFQCRSIDLPTLVPFPAPRSSSSFSTINNQQHNFSVQFFENEQKAYLAQSRTMYLEAMIPVFSSGVFSIAPAFKADHTRSHRHLAEFTLLEAEFPFVPSLTALVSIVRDFLNDLARRVAQCAEMSDIVRKLNPRFFTEHNNEKSSLKNNMAPFGHGSEADLDSMSKREMKEFSIPFRVMTYFEAIEFCKKMDILKREKDPTIGILKNEEFEFGDRLTDLAMRKMTAHASMPIVLIRKPIEQRQYFYTAKRCAEDDSLCESIDLLLPGVGLVLEGGKRIDERKELEDNLNHEQKYDSEQIENFGFFLESNLCGGSSENAGFAVGIERLMMWFLREDNIKNLVPFPRFEMHGGRGKINP